MARISNLGAYQSELVVDLRTGKARGMIGGMNLGAACRLFVRSLAACTVAACTLAAGTLAACAPPLSRSEAAEALEEAQLATQASSLTSSTIEIKTDFQIGNAVETAAQEILDFYASQLPCASTTLSGSTLTIEYGANGVCTYRGQLYSGSHSVTVSKNDMAEVIVEHSWDELANQTVEVTGEATVTWNFEDRTRRVQHSLEWTRLRDSRRGVGIGDRTQSTLDGGLFEGIQTTGQREWDGTSGRWRLGINDVEIRWVDPVPQAGSYVLDTPFDKQARMIFERVSPTKIQVRVDNGGRSFSFDVASLPDTSTP